MDGNKTINKVIPDGELNCIWVEAGLVSYKLCDRNYECEDCPFDQVMRQKPRPASDSISSGQGKSGDLKTGDTAAPEPDTFLGVIRNIFDGPFSQKPPEDRSYSHSHVWMKKLATNTYRIGIDHYAAGLLEGVGGVVLPQTGTLSVICNPCAWVLCGDGTIAVESPMNGKIGSVNSRLTELAGLLQNDPYESGWLSEIYSEEGMPKDCFDSSAIESASRSRFQQLKQEIIDEFDSRPPSLGVTLMDGGMRPRNLKDIIGPAKYTAFLLKLLSSKA